MQPEPVWNRIYWNLFDVLEHFGTCLEMPRTCLEYILYISRRLEIEISEAFQKIFSCQQPMALAKNQAGKSKTLEVQCIAQHRSSQRLVQRFCFSQYLYHVSDVFIHTVRCANVLRIWSHCEGALRAILPWQWCGSTHLRQKNPGFWIPVIPNVAGSELFPTTGVGGCGKTVSHEAVGILCLRVFSVFQELILIE